MTNEGLDSFLVTGMTETSRSQRNIKDFFAGISSEVLKSTAKHFPHIRTMDNLDIKIAELTHHMTQEFIEIEQTSTKHLNKEKKSFDQMTNLFNSDTILLTNQSNECNLNHFKKVVAITIGRILSKMVPGASFLQPLLENHYDHPNQDLNPKPAVLFIQKPLYLHEIKNDEMMEICKEIQLDFLKLTAELVPNKNDFLEDLNLIQREDCDISDREAAEKRIHSEILEAGEYIGHGDYLTFQKFYDAKRLLQPGVTALERLEFIKYFKVALFHMKMNKVIMDYRACMKNEDSIDDKLTLSWFRGWLGMDKKISNSESKMKKSGNFEIHDQFITELGIQFLANAFKNFLKNKSESINVNNGTDAQQLILDFLDESDIKYVFDIENAEEKSKFDDLLSYCKDLCSRTVLSIVLDKESHHFIMAETC